MPQEHNTQQGKITTARLGTSQGLHHAKATDVPLAYGVEFPHYNTNNIKKEHFLQPGDS